MKGFASEWERNPLNCYLEPSEEKNYDGIFSKEDVLSVSGDYGIVNQIEFKGRSFAGESVLNYGIVYTGDIVYTKSPLKETPYGIIKANMGKPGIVSTLYAVYHVKECNYPDFIQLYFENNDRLNRYLVPLVNKGAKNDMKISSENALLGNVIFPEFNEQKEISEYLSKIKKLILQQEAKLKTLQVLKAAMLEKMFPKDGSDVPEVRFAGFSGTWQKYKLKDLTDRVVRKNSNNVSSLPLTISAQYGLVDQVTYFNNRVASSNITNYYLMVKGEFAYNRSSSGGAPFGTIKRLDFYDKGVVSTLYTVFSLKEGLPVDSDFMVVLFDTTTWHSSIAQRVAEGARNHGLLNITANDFFDMDVTMPPSEEEQKKISRYFSNINSHIALHQKKLEKVLNLKTALLEQMFV